MARQKGEDLARDEGAKARDAPFFDARPFRMRARQDDRHLLIEAEAHELRLLASHHIGKGLDALIGETGDEADDAAIGEPQPFDRRGQRVGARRRFDIRCLDPAVAARDHSGSVNRKRRVRVPPGSDVTGQDRFEPGLRHRLNAVLRLDPIEGRALRIDEERAKARRSPIEHDAVRRMSGSLHALRPCARPRASRRGAARSAPQFS